jgi:hypothetical protein
MPPRPLDSPRSAARLPECSVIMAHLAGRGKAMIAPSSLQRPAATRRQSLAWLRDHQERAAGTQPPADLGEERVQVGRMVDRGRAEDHVELAILELHVVHGAKHALEVDVVHLHVQVGRLQADVLLARMSRATTSRACPTLRCDGTTTIDPPPDRGRAARRRRSARTPGRSREPCTATGHEGSRAESPSWGSGRRRGGQPASTTPRSHVPPPRPLAGGDPGRRW